MKEKTIYFEGRAIKGTPQGLKKVFDKIGYDADKLNENPNLAWNYAEHFGKAEDNG
jgi:hypothetical protein